MGQAFDIATEELPLFLSECDEHLQTLDGILVQLEQCVDDHDALQAAFRSAHTLKGMAGVIGHARMVQVTHALEALFDGVRKDELQITTELIDLCLDAVDCLRTLREEVIQGEAGELDVNILVSRFSMFKLNKSHIAPARTGEPPDVQAHGIEPGATPADPAPAPEPAPGGNASRVLEVRADIDAHSIASAARAFQLMLALQELGAIKEMQPGQALIETAAPVNRFYARLLTSQPVDQVEQVLAGISEINHLSVTEAQAQLNEPGDRPGPPAGEAEEQAARAQLARIESRKADESNPDGRASEPRPAAGSNKKTSERADMVVRTSVERLDMLMSLVGELITDRNHLSQIRNQLDHKLSSDAHFEQLNETVAHISRITDQLQEEVMRIRMLPIGNVFHKFPRMVRDLAQKTGKKTDLVIRGEATELDRSVIEEINDPLIHLLRNAVDHGIETVEERLAAGKPERGTIWLTARHEQGRILISIEDDGRGIDREKLLRKAVDKGMLTEDEANNLPEEKIYELVFVSGLSTAQEVSDISGRGVGMDIVRTNIQRINGNILIDSKPGHGTQFQVIIPLTLAIIPTLLVRVDEISMAIPIVMVAETLRLSIEDIRTVRGKPVTLLRDKVLPLIYVQDVFNMGKKGQQRQASYAVVVFYGKQQVGLVVDDLLGKEEVVVKSLGSLIGDIPGVSAATILGDGRVALILDVIGLLKTFDA